MTNTSVNNSFLSGIMTVEKTNIGSDTNIQIDNLDNTNPNSNSSVSIQSGGALGGDAYVSLSNSVVSMSIGLDNSELDSLTMSRSSSLGATNYVKIYTDGTWTYPSNTTFSVNPNSVAQFNITGDGSEYIVDQAAEIYNVNSNFSLLSDEFVVPVDGIYYFSAQTATVGGANTNQRYSYLFRNGSSFAVSFEAHTSYSTGTSQTAVIVSCVYECDAGDIIIHKISGNDLGGKVLDMDGIPAYSWFTGVLIS